MWRARWLLADGRHYGSRSGFASKREAKHFADVCEVAQREAASAPSGEPVVTVGAWWERWFPVQDLAPATLEAYAQQYRCHIAPRFADVPIGQVTGLDLAGFARELRGRGLASSSVTVILSVLRDMLADAAAEGVIAVAPVMPGRGRSRRAPVSARAGRVLDVETVLQVCARLGPQSALMVVTAAFTGMRWGEVCAMRCAFLHVPGPDAAETSQERAWYEVNARIGAVHEDVHARRYFGPPKGGHGRIVDLPPFLAALLARHIEAIDGRELLFANRRGEPIRHSDWLSKWHPACDGPAGRGARRGRRALCPGARFHDLRHTHATMLAELGVPGVLRDDRLGHHPPGVAALYTHTTPAMRTTMLEALESRWIEAAARSGVEVAGLFDGRSVAATGEGERGGSGVSRARCGRGAAAGS